MPPNPNFLPGETLPASKLQDLGRRFSWNPELQASTTNPVLGTGGTAVGSGVLLGGGLVCVRFAITFGTAGVNPGSGTYRIAGLPYDIDAAWGDNTTLPGGVWLTDASGPAFRSWDVRTSATNPNALLMVSEGGNAVNHDTQPWLAPWAVNDSIKGTATYLAAI